MGDMLSAWIAYEASKKHQSGPNMYIYRTIIDVCGLCDDYMKSRDVYKVYPDCICHLCNLLENALFGSGPPVNKI